MADIKYTELYTENPITQPKPTDLLALSVDTTTTPTSGAIEYQDLDKVQEYTDALAPVSTLYYSTDQSALVYKDASGNAAPISQLEPTGGDDLAMIQAAIDANNYARLGRGTFTVSDSIVLGERQSLFGNGQHTYLTSTNNAAAVVKVAPESNNTTIKDLLIFGGLYCIEIDGGGIGSTRCVMSNLHVSESQSHCIYLHGHTWVHRIEDCTVQRAGRGGTGDGVHSVSTAVSDHNGNALSVEGLSCTDNAGYGLNYNAQGLSLVGSHFEINDTGGVLIESNSGANAAGGCISGNYFENNVGPAIHLKTNDAADSVSDLEIIGNRITNAVAHDCIKFEGRTGSVVNVLISESNYFFGPNNSTSWFVNMGDVGNRCRVTVGDMSEANCTNLPVNTIRSGYYPGLPVATFTDTVAPNATIYHSSTAGVLSYKDASGTVLRISTS